MESLAEQIRVIQLQLTKLNGESEFRKLRKSEVLYFDEEKTKCYAKISKLRDQMEEIQLTKQKEQEKRLRFACEDGQVVIYDGFEYPLTKLYHWQMECLLENRKDIITFIRANIPST